MSAKCSRNRPKGRSQAPARNSAGNVHREEDRSTFAEFGPPKRVGVSDIARTDVHLSWQQSLRLDRIASDAPDGGPACSELLHDPKPGPTGAADNTVRLVHGSIAFRR